MRWVAASVFAGLCVLSACIATSPDGVRPHVEYGGSAGFDPGTTTTTTTTTTLPNSDPHAVTGADPAHGPFTGGQHVIVSGNGFSTAARVWFGPNEATNVVAISPLKLQVEVPPGSAGAVELAVQNGDDASTRRSLLAGYTYDALYADPSSGPTAGGTVISVYGQGANFDAASLVRVDQKLCIAQTVISATQIDCTVAQDTPGSKAISVETAGAIVTALDAYTYADSSDGFKGGLGGAALAGQLKVLVFDNYSGLALGAAHVIAGSDVASGLYAQTDDTGVVVLSDANLLSSPITVTIAARCHSPITFVDVPVDTVTAYLNPTLSPECASSGDPPPVGGKPGDSGGISGELVWQGSQEFQKGEWTNVPAPIGPEEQRIAFVLVASSDPEQAFTLPSTATAVRPDSSGDIGYAFNIAAYPGNLALYALAGILRTTPNGTSFTAYSMGAVRGVNVIPNTTAPPVYIRMSAAFDQAIELAVDPPPITPKGPDRLKASVAVEIALRQYAILPGAQKSPLLPLSGSVDFVGLPALDHDLAGMRYVVGARAVTGPGSSAPLSVVGRLTTASSVTPLAIGGFVAVPNLVAPALNAAWDGRHLAVAYPSGGWPADLTVYEVSSGNGLVRWVVAAPYADHAVTLPDLSGYELAGVPAGPLVIAVYGGHIEGFDYANLRYKNLRPSGMTASSLDYFNSHL